MKHNRVKSLFLLSVAMFFVGKASEAQVVRDSGNVYVGPVIGAPLTDGVVVVPFYAAGRTFVLRVGRDSIFGAVGYFPNSGCEGAPFVYPFVDFDGYAPILPATVVVGYRVFVQTGKPTAITAFSYIGDSGLCYPTNGFLTSGVFPTEDVGEVLRQFAPPYQFVLQ
jgi:hypothetical protein